MKKQYAVKGLSAGDYLPTGPFNTKKEAIDYLAKKSDGDHVKRHFGTFEKWADFMVYAV